MEACSLSTGFHSKTVLKKLFHHALSWFLAASCREVEFKMPLPYPSMGYDAQVYVAISHSLSGGSAAETWLLLGLPDLMRVFVCSVLLLPPSVFCGLELSVTFCIMIWFSVFWAFEMLALIDSIGRNDFKIEQLRRVLYIIALSFFYLCWSSTGNLRKRDNPKCHESNVFEVQDTIRKDEE